MTRLAAILVAVCASCAPLVDTSSDGRVHTCNVITEQGVTEHLDAYRARCGQ